MGGAGAGQGAEQGAEQEVAGRGAVGEAALARPRGPAAAARHTRPSLPGR